MVPYTADSLQESSDLIDDALLVMDILRHTAYTVQFDCDAISQATGQSAAYVQQELIRIRDAYDLNINPFRLQGNGAAGDGSSDTDDAENHAAGA